MYSCSVQHGHRVLKLIDMHTFHKDYLRLLDRSFSKDSFHRKHSSKVGLNVKEKELVIILIHNLTSYVESVNECES